MATEPYNFDFLEVFACACISRYPKLVDEIDLDIIHDESYYNYAKMVSKLSNKDTVLTYPTVIAKLDQHYAEFGFTEVDVERIMNVNSASLSSISYNDAKTQLRSTMQILKQRSHQIMLINQLEQATEMVRRGNEKEAIVMARSLKFSRAVDLASTISHMIDCVGETNVFKTGIKAFDDNGGLTKGNIMSIIGDTGSMKTMFTVWMCLRILKENPTFTCLYFEKEMPVKDIARRLIAYSTHMEIPALMNLGKQEATDIVASHFSDQSNQDTLEVLSRFRIVPNNAFKNVIDMWEYVDQYKPDIWCLDFMTQLEGMSSDSKDFNLSVMRQANKLKEMCTESDSFGIVVNQTRKDAIEQRKMKVPLKTDAEWSGTVQQVSAYIYATFNPAYYGVPVESNSYFVVGRKNRHNQIFHVPLIAYPSQCRFEEPDEMTAVTKLLWLDKYMSK